MFYNIIHPLLSLFLNCIISAGKKVSIAEPHDIVDAVREALKDRKSLESTNISEASDASEAPKTKAEASDASEEEVIKESNRSKA